MAKRIWILSKKTLRFWAIILLVTFTFLAINNYISINNVRALYNPQQS